MEKLYSYLKTAEKVYLVQRRRTIKWWHVLLDFVGVMFIAGAYGEDTSYTCYLAKFDDHWEVVVTRKKEAKEILKLKKSFVFSDNFIAGDYKYKVYHEITHDLYNYISMSK